MERETEHTIEVETEREVETVETEVPAPEDRPDAPAVDPDADHGDASGSEDTPAPEDRPVHLLPAADAG